MVGLEPGLKAQLNHFKVRIDSPDEDTLLLRNVPADGRCFSKARTSVLVKRPRAGLPFLVCVDEDLEYMGSDRELARAFAAAELYLRVRQRVPTFSRRRIRQVIG